MHLATRDLSSTTCQVDPATRLLHQHSPWLHNVLQQGPQEGQVMLSEWPGGRREDVQQGREVRPPSSRGCRGILPTIVPASAGTSASASTGRLGHVHS